MYRPLKPTGVSRDPFAIARNLTPARVRSDITQWRHLAVPVRMYGTVRTCEPHGMLLIVYRSRFKPCVRAPADDAVYSCTRVSIGINFGTSSPVADPVL